MITKNTQTPSIEARLLNLEILIFLVLSTMLLLVACSFEARGLAILSYVHGALSVALLARAIRLMWLKWWLK